MTVIKKSETVPYTDAQLFDLVTDIEKYPEFLPWCRAAIVSERTDRLIKASIQGTKLGKDFTASFIYRLIPNKGIDIQLIYTGPFRKIVPQWRFEALGGKTKFSFEIEYEFGNVLLGWTLSPIIKNEASNLLKEFIRRAKTLYG